MTLAELKAAIKTLNIPCAYGYFDGEQPPKYIVYRETLRNVIHADGRVIYSEPWITLDLVSKHRDVIAEQAIMRLLTENQIAFDDPEYDFDEEQGIHVATYIFQIEEE